MPNFLDIPEFFFLYLILLLALTMLSIIFFFARKKENSPIKLKFIVIFLLGISLTIFIINAFLSLTSTSASSTSSNNAILSNIPLFLLCFSTAIIIYSIHNTDDDIVKLDKPSFFKSRKGKIKVGKIVENKSQKYSFFLSLEDLEKHMFVCGATGTGKSNFLQNFLINFTKRYSIPFMLVEFKGEYHFLQEKINNLLIIRPGENFSINIFDPKGLLPQVHAERIFDILKSGKFLDDYAEFSPQMEKVLVEILTIVCANKSFQSWQGFYELCKEYDKKKKDEIPMLSQTIISITNRLRRFSLGSLKAIFDTENKIKTEDIFQR
ncbi:MAG: helicase HerA domain-containing protein, partial [Promethearchaeota archaeon]